MRLQYFAGSILPSPTANSVHVMQMAHALATNGHEVTLFAKQGEPVRSNLFAHYGLPENFDLCLIPMRGRRSLPKYLARVLQTAKPDAAVGRYLYPLLVQAHRGVPVVYETHAPGGRLRTMLERHLWARSSFQGTVFITKALLRLYQERTGMMFNQSLVLPDAARDPGPPTAIRQCDRLQIGFAGSWHAGRGTELIVELARQAPQFDFHMAGGSTGDLANSGIQVPANLRCLGFLDPAAVPAFLMQMDVLLAPYDGVVHTRRGGLNIGDYFSPMKLFEYMAAGRCIVASNLAVLSEVLQHDHNSLLVADNRPETWLAALTRLDEDAELATRIAQTARCEFESSYTWSQRALQFVGLLEE